MNILKDLHERFRPYTHITPALVRRYTKFHWEDCEEIRDELLDIREREKELLAPPKRKKYERIK
jgi:hypothetical protein